MKEKNPVSVIALGIILFLVGHFAPNGIELSNVVEVIGFINLFTALAEGLGIGLIIGGAFLFIKGRKG